MSTEIPDLVGRINRELERAARPYVDMSGDLAKAVITAAAFFEPALYGDAADQVRQKRLNVRVTVQARMVTVSLISAATGECVGTPFQYLAPVNSRG